MSRKAILSVVALTIATGAFCWWYFQRYPAGFRPALSSREIATRVLAEHLARTWPAAKTLVIGNPFVERSGLAAEVYAFERASLRGLQLGFGAVGPLNVVHPELRPEELQRPEAVFVDPKTTTPLSFLVTDDAFDKLLQANAGVQLVISLIGVPVRLRDCSFWREPNPLPLALLLPDWRMIGPGETIREAFRTGKIAAAVVNRPGVASEESAITGQAYRAEFEHRFFLVTQTNIDALLLAYPKLF